MKKIYLMLFTFFVVACASAQVKNNSVTIDNIKILTQGNSIEDSDDMREVCKSFKLTKKQVLLYYLESKDSTEQEIHDSYNILPCNSTGTIIINNKKYSWIIRAGGVGTFYNKNKIILRVCDKKCCNTTKGIC